MDYPKNAAEKDLITMFNTLYTNDPPFGAVSPGASQTNAP
jgi:hypothetical protein